MRFRTLTLTAGALASVRHLKAHPELRVQHQERAATLKARFAAAAASASIAFCFSLSIWSPIACSPRRPARTGMSSSETCSARSFICPSHSARR